MKPAPKDPQQNIAYRRALIQKADTDPVLQSEIWARCTEDLIWFVDTFGWTYSPKDYPDCPDRPFILYEFQEETLLKVDAALGVHDLLGEKSRDMGFTWLMIAVAEWRWHFRKKQSFLFGSRKEEYVDRPGDPKTIFWKADYLIQNLPPWLQPYYERTSMHFLNLETGSTIDGESTNDNFARGDRRTAIFLDEFPAVENGYQITKAAGDATNCCVYFGTSMGAAGAFYDIRTKMLAETPERIVRLHWSRHPEKQVGLYTSEKDANGVFQLRILDKDCKFPANYQYKLDGKLRSIAYDERERRAPNRQVMAQEWDIDYLASGWQFFDPVKLDEIKAKTVRDPNVVGTILLDPDWKHPRWKTGAIGGDVQLWFSPLIKGNDDDLDEARRWVVPAAWNDMVCGVDISLGSDGEYSSNSVASFVRRSTGEKIAQFTTKSQNPTEFCRHVLALCKWFNDAYLIWEGNGPGVQFTNEVKKSGYRNVYYSEKNEKRFIDEKSAKPGWWTNKDNKKILLEDYSNALISGKFINHSAEAIAECGQYVHQPNGTIEHARSRATSDPTATGENHGDIVCADALANIGVMDLTKRQLDTPPQQSPPPPRSFGARSLAARAALDKPRRWGDFSRRRSSVG